MKRRIICITLSVSILISLFAAIPFVKASETYTPPDVAILEDILNGDRHFVIDTLIGNNFKTDFSTNPYAVVDIIPATFEYKNNVPVVAAVHLGKHRGRMKVSRVASVHSRVNEISQRDTTQNFIDKQTEKGNFVHANKKSQSWFTTFGLQLPSVVQTYIDLNDRLTQNNASVNTYSTQNSEKLHKITAKMLAKMMR